MSCSDFPGVCLFGIFLGHNSKIRILSTKSSNLPLSFLFLSNCLFACLELFKYSPNQKSQEPNLHCGTFVPVIEFKCRWPGADT